MKVGINERKAALGEAQSLLHWDLDIVKPPKAIGAPDKDVILRITTTSMPLETEEYQKATIGGFDWNASVKVTKSGTLPFETFEGTDGKVNEYFLKLLNAKWSANGKDSFGKQHTMADIKCDMRISLKGPDDIITRTFTLIGCIIKRSDRGGTLGQDASLLKPAMEVAYDDFHEGLGTSQTY